MCANSTLCTPVLSSDHSGENQNGSIYTVFGSIGYFILAFGPYCERIIKVKLPEEDDDGVSGYLEKLDLY